MWGKFLADRLLSDPRLAEQSASRNLVKPLFARRGEARARNVCLSQYLRSLAVHFRACNGAIVMNANPFTLGHLHLVEIARRQVNFLYVFVVEENESAISFEDRFAMVQKNCQGMENVEVLPSGRYMISTLTFPEYFEKEAKQDVKIVPSKDVRLFGEAIAPTLGITKRFVGEEPFDKVTQQYNEAMKYILPDYGVDVVEIPRKTAKDGNVINATQVRAWIKEGAWDKCAAYLPQATMDILKHTSINN